MAPAFKMMDARNLTFVEAMLATHIESEESQVRLVSVQVSWLTVGQSYKSSNVWWAFLLNDNMLFGLIQVPCSFNWLRSLFAALIIGFTEPARNCHKEWTLPNSFRILLGPNYCYFTKHYLPKIQTVMSTFSLDQESSNKIDDCSTLAKFFRPATSPPVSYFFSVPATATMTSAVLRSLNFTPLWTVRGKNLSKWEDKRWDQTQSLCQTLSKCSSLSLTRRTWG